MDNGQLDGLIALKLVAERRNFSSAAATLGMSPSAISQTIRQLESRLGVTLLTRTTRTTTLTETGERFLNQAGPAIDQLLAAIAEVGKFANKPAGLLRLNLPRLLYPSYLQPIITGFRKCYPDVAVELYFEDAMSDVVDLGFDAGIRLSDILAKDMVALKLYGPVRFVVVGSPKYLSRAGRPRHPRDLLKHDCLLMRLGRERLYDRWEFEQRGADFQVQVKGSMIFNDSVLMQRAVEDGAGLMYTTEDAVVKRVKCGKLEIVLNQYAAVSTGFYLYYPKRSQVAPKLRAFVEYVKEYNASARR